MPLPAVDAQSLLNDLTALLQIPSPTGFTDQAITHIQESLETYPNLILRQTRKGSLVALWPGQSESAPRALTAHVDTLGAMVKRIKSNGRLELFRIGGLVWGGVETESVTVFLQNGATLRGSFLVNKASAHVYGKEALETKRSADTMEVRLDARTTNADETRALGVQVGDFVAFDPRIEINNGFIRSRFLDDKACVACILAAVKTLEQDGLQPAQNTYLHFSNYEEVGHGAAAGIPP
ncbi:MAG TPA: peptidase M42, partial [Anaerolineales bacterium]|nr:peptidase M42 [Anaerolineales bacterium]